MPKKVLIATGGTGGHIYPAVALAEKCIEEGLEVLFIGGGLSDNKYFDRHAFDFRSISCATFAKKNLFSFMSSSLNILKGVRESQKIINEFKPTIVVGFGSYYSFPPLITAKLNSIPFVLHEANSIPGKVNKLLSSFARASGVHFPKTISLLKGNVYEVGMPLRKEFQKGSMSCCEAKTYYNFSLEGKVVLVFGGSQGARLINEAMLKAVALMNERNQLQVIHITGDPLHNAWIEKEYERLGISACVKVFENKMQIAWQAADIVISRAGASSIAEQVEFEVPGILIPFQRAADDHQTHNAKFLVETIKGAKVLKECELTHEALANLLRTFLDQNSLILKEMKQAIMDYKKKMRTYDLFHLIIDVINGLKPSRLERK